MNAAIKYPTGPLIFSFLSQFLPPLNHTAYVNGSDLQGVKKNLVSLSQMQCLLRAGGKEELFILNVLCQLRVLFVDFFNTDSRAFLM